LTRPDRRGAPAPVFEQKEGTMITLQDHIDELRAELRGCLNRRERAKIAAELEAAIAALKEQDRAADAKRPPV
jgi:AMMECR1 domain-containing protein